MQTDFEAMGGIYTLRGDYQLPNLEVPGSPKVGTWGELRRKHLRDHKEALYTAMLLGDTLNAHLAEVDRTATELYDRLARRLVVNEGVAEGLKVANQMDWVRCMNNICQRAKEIVYREIVYG